MRKFFKLKELRKEREEILKKPIGTGVIEVLDEFKKEPLSKYVPIFFEELKNKRADLNPIYFEKLLLLTRSIPVFYFATFENEHDLAMEVLEDVKKTMKTQSLKELEIALLVFKDIKDRNVRCFLTE